MTKTLFRKDLLAAYIELNTVTDEQGPSRDGCNLWNLTSWVESDIFQCKLLCIFETSSTKYRKQKKDAKDIINKCLTNAREDACGKEEETKITVDNG